jgi:hypothetical protein
VSLWQKKGRTTANGMIWSESSQFGEILTLANEFHIILGKIMSTRKEVNGGTKHGVGSS